MRKDKLLYHILCGILRIVALMPLGVLYVLSDGAYVLLYHCVKYRRLIARENLLKSFPEKDTEEIERIERKYYHHLCDCFVETIKLLHISDKELRRRVKVEGGENIDRLARDGRPVVLYLGHYGNWEWVPVITWHFTPLDFNGQVYRPVKWRVMDMLMLRIRSRFRSVCVPQKKVFRMMTRMRREGKRFAVAFIADQRPNSRNLNHWTTFLNQKTAYAPGGDEIGERVNAHYVYVDVRKTGRGNYGITLSEMTIPLDTKEEYPHMLAFMRMMEETIRRAPEYWLWTHRRWLHPKY